MSEVHTIEGERGISPAARPPMISRRHGAYMLAAAALAALLFLWLPTINPKQPKVAPDPVIGQGPKLEQVRETTSNPPPTDPTQPKSGSRPPETQTSAPPAAAPPKDTLAEAFAAAPLADGGHQTVTTPRQAPAGTPGAAVQPVAAQGSELAARLHVTSLDATEAVVLPHPEMMITMGMLVPCTLQTAMQSDTPGKVVGRLSESVYGTTGSVELLPAGTRLVGEYGRMTQNGSDRLFVLWERAETPDHVIIALGSPGTDALGRAGFGGQMERHVWQKFGAAGLLMLVDGGLSLGQAALSKEGSTNINIGSASSMANTVLQNTINIPDTLHKNQGERVAMLVARDFDFSKAYRLSTR